jgi:hypothetical protein
MKNFGIFYVEPHSSCVRLGTKPSLVEVFLSPDTRVISETFLGMTKSIIALRAPNL